MSGDEEQPRATAASGSPAEETEELCGAFRCLRQLQASIGGLSGPLQVSV